MRAEPQKSPRPENIPGKIQTLVETACKGDGRALHIDTIKEDRCVNHLHACCGSPAAAASLSVAQPANATEAAGVRFDDKTSLAGSELVLNGAALRTQLPCLKIYAIGSYTFPTPPQPRGYHGQPRAEAHPDHHLAISAPANSPTP